LCPSDVEALVVTKRNAGLPASTVWTIYTVLRSALDIAARDGLIRSNPAAAVRRPGVERKDAPHLTAEQAQALLEAIRGDRLESLFRLISPPDCAAVRRWPCTGPTSTSTPRC
jgi:site-specific recombinase XerC